MKLRMLPLDAGDWGTVSMLHVPTGGALYVIERPWLPSEEFPYGVPGKSCVPAGTYKLVHQHSPSRDKPMWYLQGVGVSVRQVSAEPTWRWGCMFHAGNYPTDVEGCLAPGMRYSDKQMVMNSGDAMNELDQWLKFQDYVSLVIERADVG